VAVNYKVDAATARTMATAWYALAGRTPDPQGLAHWTAEIQKDGSHTAFGNFSNGIQAAGQGATLQANVDKLKKSAGLNPWQPNAETPQLAGTNTKIALGPSGGLTHGGNTGNPTIDALIKAVAEIGAGALTGGAAAPFVGAAVGGIDSAVTPGSNLGNIVGNTASGAAMGALGGKLGGAGGLLGGSSSSLPGPQAVPTTGGSTGGVQFDASGNPIYPSGTNAGNVGNASNPGSMTWDANGNPVYPSGTNAGNVGNASNPGSTGSGTSGSSGTGSGTGGGSGGAPSLPGPAAVAGGLGGVISGLGGLGGGTAGGGSGGGINGVINGITGNSGLTAALAAAQLANAAQLSAKSTDFADQAGNTAKDRWAAQAPLRSAGTAGMLNPTTPDLSNLSALRSNNPFARPLAVPTAPASSPSVPQTGGSF
jgi:hypothetical protein